MCNPRAKGKRNRNKATSSRGEEQTQANRERGFCVLMATYEDNAYNWLKSKGLAAKYEHAGIYCIKIDGKIVYIGKSANMLRRIA